MSAFEDIEMSHRARSHQSSREELDNQELSRLGKRPVLKRNFGFISMLSLACTVLITWEGVLFLFLISFSNGGYAGAIYEYLLVWVGTVATFATMGELASMAPTAGGQYHWVSMLSPPSSRKFLSYMIGWLTMVGWQAVVASGCYLCATLVVGLIVLQNPVYAPTPWQIMLVYWATVVFAIFVNTVIAKVLPKVESMILILHIFGFFAILVPLVYMGPRGNAKEVFTVFSNEGGWSSQGLSFFIGLVGPAFSLLGADGAVHMCEEIKNPAQNVPRAMVFALLLNGALGFGMLIAALFFLGNLDYVLATPTHYPFMAIFQQAVGSVTGALSMSALITILCTCATIGSVATASRLTWAFARDRGTPGWRYLSKIEPRSTLPLMAIALTATIAILLSLIGLGSTVAFNIVVSVAINGLYTSYLIGNTLLLYHRVRGNIRPYSPYDTGNAASMTLRNQSPSNLTWGPWRVPEPWGTIINVFGCCYMIVLLFFSYWPMVAKPTVEGMNYSVVMVVGTAVISLVYYLVVGKRSYKGPIVEVELDK